jgi:hypothetical protein|tara:strand:- start:2373 stop:2600 length:228 start_codon:yes stop_codon:yes gene_type:complete
MSEVAKIQHMILRKEELIQDAIQNQKDIEAAIARYFPQFVNQDPNLEEDLDRELRAKLDKQIAEAIQKDLQSVMG